MGRSPCCAKEGLNRGAWTAIEDHILTEYITNQGEGNWRNLPKRAGLKRCGKSCRLRWLNYLRPDIKRGNITRDEEDLIIRLHKLLGNRWSLIAGRLPGRTDNEIKNYWNTSLSKKLHLHHHNHHNHNHDGSSPTRKSRKIRKIVPLSRIENSPLGPESKAVRTKAVRCNRVFVHDDPNVHRHNPILPNPETCNNDNIPSQNATAVVNVNDAGCRFVTDNCDLHQENNNMGLDFGGMDEFGYLDIYGLQGSEFSDIDNVDFGYEDADRNRESSSPSSEQPLVFSDEMFEDWTRTNTALYETAGGVHDQYWLPSLN
ncbi:hypothetical protein Droror1_Dr00005968 [Drosera rotundifolia]